MCKVCWQLHRYENPHLTCLNVCKLCFQEGCDALDIKKKKNWYKCNDCNRYYPNRECYRNHTKLKYDGGASTCSTYRKCTDCSRVVSVKQLHPPRKHNCGLVYCVPCKDYKRPSHACYIKHVENDPEKDKKRWAKSKIYYYDFETTVEDGVHKPIMVAYACSDNTDSGYFWGDDCVVQFGSKIMRKEYKNSVFLAHNAGRFDEFFILEHFLALGEKPEVIFNGGSILNISLPTYNITFRDTYLYLPRALSALPKMFGLEDTEKTFFPHLLQFSVYENYKGDYPPIEKYGIDGMKEDAREKCIKWHQHMCETKSVFEYKEHMIEYCRNDVDVLRKCGEKFRTLFLEYGSVDPYIDGITLSHSVSLVYRKLHMPIQSLAIIPPWGYKSAKSFSNKAINWLHYVSKKTDIPIQHARNGGEYKLPSLGIYVDGYTSLEEVNTVYPNKQNNKPRVYEFMGCLYHGCDKCYDKDVLNPQHGVSLTDLYEKTMVRNLDITNAGYDLIQIWEHEYDKMLTNDDLLKQCVNELGLIEPLKPKDCLYGGRTESFILYKDTAENEKIRYIDVNSLYPYVQRSKIFPEGHPEILLNPEINDISNWFGLIKCRVLPPQNLWIPVLPIKARGKLMFALCNKCAVNGLTEKCEHTSTERSWVGSYTTVEIDEALKNGYEILHVHEVWNWGVGERTNDLFTSFINTFLKIKLTGAGFPSYVVTDLEKINYCKELKSREDIDITPEEITDNPGIRNLGKSALNSLWGKLCQGVNKEKNIYITEPHKFYEMLVDDTCEITSVNIVQEYMLQVSYKDRQELEKPNSFSNHVVGSFVTSYARLHLYSFLKQLGKDCVYCDTDSVVYIERDGHPQIPTGPYLGEMSCEIYSSHKVNDTIKTWVSSGPKSYAYMLKDNPHIKNVKCKGMTLNYTTCLNINFEYMKLLVTDPEARGNKCEVVYRNQIKRNKKKIRIEQTDITKSHSFTFDKRRMVGDYITEPFGYSEL